MALNETFIPSSFFLDVEVSCSDVELQKRNPGWLYYLLIFMILAKNNQEGERKPTEYMCLLRN